MAEYTTEECLLRRYLDRYRNMQLKKAYLQRKLREIESDFETSAFHAVSADGVTSGGCATSTVPTYIMQKDAIITDILRKTNEAAEVLVDIQNIIYKLPDESQEQIALDAKYISRMSIYEICDLLYVSRPTAYRIIERGINALLLLPEVRDKLTKYSFDIMKQNETV